MPAFWIDKTIDKLVECETIKEEEKELYSYGLQQGLIIIANLFTTILIGFIFDMVWASVFFMTSYLPLRSFAGGYHAKTHFKCYLLSIVLTSVVLVAVRFVHWTSFLNLALVLFAGVIIFILAPVEDRNKPLDQSEIAVYKKWTRIILMLELFFMILAKVTGLVQIELCISISVIVLSMMLVIGRVKLKLTK